ncbi:hypothetical protein POTOM_021697 [Populus tomentosa]|uniref:Alginate lyase 2 domain-containing protein n=1 Tax=Populus tomentosa TaxID=118781 RepID=A0A8X7ZQX9_POPTO|nr:hypothetical protein POTOM_021697 [Populus tomentosa]
MEVTSDSKLKYGFVHHMKWNDQGLAEKRDRYFQPEQFVGFYPRQDGLKISSSGEWQFEGYGFVPNGTSGVTVAQIHGAFHGATALILRIYDGNMRLTVFIDGEERYSTHDQGPGDLYFKCGVYAAPRNISYYMESRWRDIKIYKK